jgi:uncharacterized protein YndB with AHSA1/START domain
MPETHDTDLGTLTRSGDEWTLTFTRHLAHPPDKVWRAISEPEHLEVWFPDRIEGERRAGAALRFVPAEHPDQGFEGEMLTFDPPKLMELRWGTDHLRIELTPEDDGTLLTFVDTFAELGKAARDGAGWHECLARLEADLAGDPAPRWGATWAEIHPAYVEALGPEASSIGPPEGWEQPS